MDWTDRLEINNPHQESRLHCEGLTTLWVHLLEQRSDLDPSSTVLYTCVIRSFFRHLLPSGRARLRFPKRFPKSLLDKDGAWVVLIRTLFRYLPS